MKMQKLPESLSSRIRAAQNIPSIYKIVEELILNSIDANSTQIEVCIELNSLKINVKDDGDGIAYDSILGWNRTSKRVSTSKFYGRRGETLASICDFADIEICSKTEQDASFHCRDYRTGSSMIAPSMYILETNDKNVTVPHGTFISINNLFESLPVRKKAIKIGFELNKIKEFAINMSILHYKVNWYIVAIDEFMNNFGKSESKVIFSCPATSSVASQFSNVHSCDRLSGLKEVSVISEIDNSIKIHGLISIPSFQNSHNTKDYQHFYINNQWIRNSNCYFTNKVNEVYKEILKASGGPGSRGPSPKHYEPDSINQKTFPTFVLQLIYPSAYYNCDDEIDQCFYEDTHKDLFDLLIKKMIKSIQVKSVIQMQDSPHELDNEKESIIPSPISLFHIINSNQNNTVNNRFNDMFSEAFLTTEKLPSRNLNSDLCIPSMPGISDIPDLLPNRMDKLSDSSNILGISVSRNKIPEEEYYDSLLNSDVMSSSAGEPISQDSNEINIFLTSMKDETQMASRYFMNNQINKSKEFEKLQLQHELQSYLSNDDEVHDQIVTVYKNQPINKKMLHSASLVGQVEDKYILFKSINPENSHQTIVFAADQHAIDERIRFEKLMKNNNPMLNYSPIQVRFEIRLEKAEVYIVESKDYLLKSWGFSFYFQPTSNSSVYEEFYRKRRYSEFEKSNILILTQVPIICDESLTQNDFREFLHEISKHYELPDSILKPPAIHRIIASKSCRYAIKFGDELADSKCDELLYEISKTSLPFQCAHGRPSIVPLSIIE